MNQQFKRITNAFSVPDECWTVMFRERSDNVDSLVSQLSWRGHTHMHACVSKADVVVTGSGTSGVGVTLVCHRLWRICHGENTGCGACWSCRTHASICIRIHIHLQQLHACMHGLSKPGPIVLNHRLLTQSKLYKCKEVGGVTLEVEASRF